ncbi:MAG: CheR family methyltransferase [Bacteroidota bacterium]
MDLRVNDELLSRFAAVVAERMGLSFPKERWSDLERGILSAGVELGFHEPESTIRWFLSSQPDKSRTEILASHLTVGETYFFRDAKSFQALEERLLPTLISSRRQDKRLRIWSAGCCTGEEPYSIAILLHSLLPDFQEWTITLLATDINPRFLRKASEGVYGDWSFRDTPAWVKERYFTRRRDGRFEIIPVIRSMVTLTPLNVVDDSYPSFVTNTNAMDLVLCRNVLMYFLPHQARKVVEKFFRSLVSSGWLLVSPSEMSQTLFPEFETVQLSGALCYRKRTEQPQHIFPTLSSLEEAPALAVDAEERDEPDTPMVAPSPWSPIAEESDDVAKETPKASGSQEVYLEAHREYERGHFTKAAERILASLPASPTAVWRAHPIDAALLSLLARIRASQGDLAGAEEQCRKAIEADKLNPVHPYLHATIVHEQGRDDEAIHSLRKALYLDPDFALAHFLLANLARRHGKTREAGKHFRETLRLLSRYRQDQILPESDGMTAGRLKEIIHSVTQREIGL